MDDDLICNFKKCRKRLNAFAWVTSCSHIFCDEDGSREFGKQSTCPACDTELTGKYDIIRVDLQPSEQYKSMVLAGQRPEIIMEICSRALSFWTYQAHQERAYQEFCASKALEKAQQQESYYDQMMATNQSELTSLKSQVSVLKKELESTKTKYSEASEKLMEKSRQFQKLQGMYETMRRRHITPATFEGVEHGTPRHRLSLAPHHHHHQFEMPLGTVPHRNASLPPGYVEKVQDRQLQPTGLSLPAPGLLPEGMAFTSSSAAMVAQTNLHPHDPNLAALVNSHAVGHPMEGRPQERFNIKISHSTHHGMVTHK